MTEEISEYKIYDVRCKDVMEEDGVRFVGLLNDHGKLVAGGYKLGVKPLEKNEEEFRNFIKRVIEISLRKEHDDTLGKLNYVSCRRDKVVLISFPFPISSNILLVSAEPHVNIEKLASRVTRIFGDANLFSEWDMQSSK